MSNKTSKSKTNKNRRVSLKLKKFDMDKIGDDKVCVFIGKRETGKSFLVKDLLYYHKDIPMGTVISATEGANHFFSKIVPSACIYEEFDKEIVQRILTRQKKIAKSKDNGRINSKIDDRIFFILDDCLYDNSWTKDKNMRSVFMNGRHYKILFLMTMQFALGIPPSLRTNIDYVFILRENIVSNRKKLYEHYAGMFPDFNTFCQAMDATTENYECMVIHNNAKSNKIEDQVFWYKAEEHEDFKMCSKEFWQYSNNNFNNESESEDDDDIFNSSSINIKKEN
tara:strand:- start:1441 stop:2283 length:843 start_codon:yes stop_codon:yes gene_type:complete